MNMDYPIGTLENNAIPALLRETPEVPTKLYYRGTLPSPHLKLLAVVGSRNYTNYGRRVTEILVEGLRGYDVGIISGLALGIDGFAHEAALRAQLYTLAVPGSGLSDDVLYPRRHLNLAKNILVAGGGLLSEYEPDFKATTWSFPKRNRIMAGISHATLVVEAGERSGTLITSRLATDYNRDVLAVPGDIFSAGSAGPHMLIKLGATPVTSPEDILETLHLETTPETKEQTATASPLETEILSYIGATPTDKDSLIRLLGSDATLVSVTLMQMEIQGSIVERSGIFYKI